MAQQLHPWGAAVVATICFLIYRFLQAIGVDGFALWVVGGVGALHAFLVIKGLAAALSWDTVLSAMRRPTGLYGRVETALAKDADKIGLSFTNQDGNGIPIGGAGGKIIYYHGVSHMSMRAATNAGKTESSSALICFALGGHRNLIVTAKGPELAWLAAQYRRDVLGQNVVIVDPWGLMKQSSFKSSDFNPIGHYPAYAAKRSPELLDKSRSTALQLSAEPENGGGENKIFRVLGRELIAGVIAHKAIEQADTGELCCNLPHISAVLGGSERDLRKLLSDMVSCDAYAGSIRRVADRFLARLERSPKLAESILSEANAALELYDAGGPLAECTEFSDFDPTDLKKVGKPMSVFFVTPPEKSPIYGAHVGLCLNALIDLCIEADSFEPRVTIVADEFAALGVMPSALPVLYLGRSRGVQLVSYVQDTSSYSRYGKEASAFTTQAEVVAAWAIRSTSDAKEYSERSGQRSVVTESFGLPGRQGNQQHSLNLNEKGVPVFRPDDFLQLPDYTAAVFFRQNPPIVVDLVSYRTVDPWRVHAKPVPGAQPLAALPVKYKA